MSHSLPQESYLELANVKLPAKVSTLAVIGDAMVSVVAT